MDLVNEQDGGLAGVFETVLRGGENAAHVGDVGFHAAEALELALGLPRDDLREGGFARAGRAVEDQRLDAVGFDGAAQELAGREDVLLPGVFGRATAAASARRAVDGAKIFPRPEFRRSFRGGGG
jgi:hypothetical protein